MAFPDVEPDASRRRPAGGGFARLMAAYALACLAAVIVLPVLLFLRDLVAIGPAAAAQVDLAALAAIVVVGFPVIFVFAAPFATALIVVTQALRLTAPVVYALGGAVTGPVVGLLAHLMPAIAPAPGPAPWGSYLLYAVVGLASGVVFWYSAVRSSRPRR